MIAAEFKERLAMEDNIVYRQRAIIEEQQENNFQEMMDLIYEGHPYYKRLLIENNLKRDDFECLSDLTKLPVTFKQDYMDEPDLFRLHVDNLPLEMKVIWDVMYTTGTTSGQPTPFYSTTYDFYNILTINRSMLEIRGVQPTDIIANLCPLTLYPHGAFIRVLHAACSMHIPVVSPLPGKPSPHFHLGSRLDEVIDIISKTRVTILWGVPSYIRRILMRALELKVDFSAVRLVFVTGEMCSEGLRADIIQNLKDLGAHDPNVSVSYGATELQGGIVECSPGNGFHNPAPDQFYIEIVDPVTHKPLQDGQEGLILITHLKRRGTILLRYALGDITTKTSMVCPYCGSHTDRILHPPKRADDLIKVKGMLVNPNIVNDILSRHREITEYQVVIEKEDPDDINSMDVLSIRIATQSRNKGRLRDSVVTSIKEAIGVTPIVIFLEPNRIFDPDKGFKSKRLLDRRPK
jgi:phenylacetate-coenzyme A ligase PaaK-like adenylate-forming protein